MHCRPDLHERRPDASFLWSVSFERKAWSKKCNQSLLSTWLEVQSKSSKCTTLIEDKVHSMMKYKMQPSDQSAVVILIAAWLQNTTLLMHQDSGPICSCPESRVLMFNELRIRNMPQKCPGFVFELCRRGEKGMILATQWSCLWLCHHT